MAQTIDLKTTTLVVQPSKTVKFANVMGGAQGAGGKNVSFANKEYANVAKTVVLVGQSLKKLNINVRDMKKLMLEEKTFRKEQLARELRRERESRIEKSRGIGRGVKGAAGAAAGATKSLLERLLAPLAGLGQILTGIVGGRAIQELLNTDFVRNAVTGLVNMVRAITDAIGNVPEGLGGKVGNALKRLFQFVGNFVGGSIGRTLQGLDKILKPDGTFKFSLDGIFKLVTGLGGLALTFRYLKNPTRIIKDVGSVLSFLVRGIGGLARMIPKNLRLPGLGGAASAMKGGAGNVINAVKGAPGAIRGGVQSVGDFFTRNRAAVNWGGPPTSTMPRVTRGARAISEYGQGAVQAGLRNTPRALAGGARGLMGGARGLMGGIGGAAKAGFSKIGTRIPILGSLLAGGMEFAESGDVGKAGGAGIGAGLGTAIGAGVGSVIPGAGTLVGGLAGGIIGEFIGKTIGGGVTEMFKGFDFKKVLFEPVMDAFVLVGEAFKPLVDMFLNAFGIGKDGKETGENGFVTALKNVGKVIGIIAKVLIKAIGPLMKVIASTLKYVVKAVTFIIKGVVGAIEMVMSGIVNLIRLIPGQGDFSFGKMLGDLNKMVDGIDTSSWGEFARGGKIFGGKPTGDSIPAFLERGEYVMNRNAVRAIGPDTLNALNFGAFPRFMSGGQILEGAKRIVGLKAGVGDMCAYTTRAALAAAGHPAAEKRTQLGDLDTPRGTAYNGRNFAASFGGSDMGKVITSKSSIKAGDIILWRADRNKGGNINKGAITHVGIAASDGLKTQYDHNRSKGWHLRNHWDSYAGTSWFAGVRLGGSGGSLPADVSPAGSTGGFSGDSRADKSGPSSSSGGGGIFDKISLSPTAGGSSGPGLTMQAGINQATTAIMDLIKPLKEGGFDLGVPLQSAPQMAQQNVGGAAESLMGAADSAGSIMNNLYEMFSAGGNG